MESVLCNAVIFWFWYVKYICISSLSNGCVVTLIWTGQKRSMFIQTQSTPNPLSLMFYPGKPVMEVGSADFPNARTAMNSPLAKALYGIDGQLFFSSLLFSYAMLLLIDLGWWLSNMVELSTCSYIIWWCRDYSCFLWFRFCDCNQVRRCYLGFSKTRNICSNYGLLFIWEPTVSGLSHCSFYGYSYSWSMLNFLSFPILHDYIQLF